MSLTLATKTSLSHEKEESGASWPSWATGQGRLALALLRVSLQSTTTRARLGLGSFVVTICKKFSGVALGFHSGPWFSLCPDTWMVLRCLDAASSIPTGLLGHQAGGVPSSPWSSGIAGSPVSPPAPCPDGTGGTANYDPKKRIAPEPYPASHQPHLRTESRTTEERKQQWHWLGGNANGHGHFR